MAVGILVIVISFMITHAIAVFPPQDAKPEDIYSFMALLDITFVTSRRQTCTGSIIHDKVVLTAAHCFGNAFDPGEPEMTLSFVVVGTSKMFDSNNELYLPMEKILRHPEYNNAEMADLAMVFTFASMTSDRPGSVIGLCTNPTTSSKDTGIMVLSWSDGFIDQVAEESDGCDPYEEECQSHQSHSVLRQRVSGKKEESDSKQKVKRTKTMMNEQDNATEYEDSKEYLSFTTRKVKSTVTVHEIETQSEESVEYLVLNPESTNQTNSEATTISVTTDTTPLTLSIGTTIPNHRQYRLENKTEKIGEKNASKVPHEVQGKGLQRKTGDENWHIDTDSAFKTVNRDERYFFDTINTQKPNEDDADGFLGTLNNMRKSTRLNNLSVANYTFLSGYSCKKAFDEYKQTVKMKSEAVVCYTPIESHMILNAGAPVLRAGKLMAITIGALKMTKSKIAYGVKVACYCSWIKKHLPRPSASRRRSAVKLNYTLVCCDNCCDPNILDMNRNRLRA